VTGAIPGYWMHETSGVLRPAVEAYLRHDPMTPGQIAAVRGYLHQWFAAPAWKGPMIDPIRTAVEAITCRADISRVLEMAVREGIDPL
jgi:hypothetical protein